jgi:hypothetical protein
MSGIITWLILFVAIAVFFVVAIVLARMQNKKTQQSVAELAARKGWRFQEVKEPFKTGFRVYGRDWILEGLKDSSENHSTTGSTTTREYIRLFTDQVSMSPGILLIGPKQPVIDLGGLNEILKMTVVKLMIGDDTTDSEGIEESQIGRIALHDRYMVMTNNEDTARGVLTPRVEEALIAFPGKVPPAVKINNKGLEVKLLSSGYGRPGDIEGVVAIANAFLL